jgi:CRISPR/Cas system CSM-associated protein Csm5 (group 7 of RAMP superfamily)
MIFPRGNPDAYLGRDEGFAFWPREKVPELDAAIRIKSFQEVAMVYSDKQAAKEARNLREELMTALEDNAAAWFEYEEDKMYSRRESELIQKYLQAHGAMPGGSGDDLF